MVLEKLESHRQKIGTGPLSYSIHKASLKRIKDLNIIPETIKLLEENIDKLFGIGLSIGFLSLTPKVKQQKEN